MSQLVRWEWECKWCTEMQFDHNHIKWKQDCNVQSSWPQKLNEQERGFITWIKDNTFPVEYRGQSQGGKDRPFFSTRVATCNHGKELATE